ncbi:biopolymer transporter ExbD [Cetobacterium somerae]|uniref:ExbD/TolR family protein n=1 Tax=Cetobacterium sp. NK01 TaxID=2993530 RepID=UPI0021168A8A|nr:biopolymer transporter ExbD [Cetobacterium sp. NK01]MCQ8211962.1 biopolymer transporter ExbD [Cetobacterium sp. NK01]
MKRRTKRRSLATPDLTPLIDVVFLLLIFFMLVTTFDKYSGFKLELPKGEIVSESSKGVYELVIDKDENYFLMIDKVSNPVILEKIGEKIININEMTISADKDLKYEVIVKSIGILKNNGVDKVELNFYE